MKGLSEWARACTSALAAVGCFAASTGCYSYLEVPPATVPAGTRVRAHLSTAGVLRLETVLGGPERQVEGEVVQADNSGLLLLARTGIAPTSAGSYVERQRVLIEQREILSVEERRLERGRTAAFTGVGAVALVGVAIWLFNARSSGRDVDEGTGDGDLARFPRW